MGELRGRRERFSRKFAVLILVAHELGFTVAIGDVKRCKKCPGSPKSLHLDGLAGDLNIYKEGVYQRTTEAHETLGKIWEMMGGTWGGRFSDGNHYSMEWQGRK